ncbi:LysR family transcriptional regulator [Pelagicoccus sp. NFK12]|uniref:LysR family transcriptional regulator n=1 Tax=Pelagicoccus enzymogenes TaxID=2773457 RepID=A0A927F7X8_9BACT|nr:LysR family transcriptional regulator [Pelagicoccus enzymogenes]MBD5779590.1 LysR family transcriptional regulator [Pelagicoccus enzymogenes]
MEIAQLKSFLVLAEQLHYGRAAAALHLSQPALTKQIQRLEEDLGGALFERGTQGTRLSAFGEQWLQEARQVNQKLDGLLDRGRQIALGETGRIRIGFGYHSLELVPSVVVKLRDRAPGIQISLRDMSTAEQLAALEEGKLDLAFVRVPIANHSDYESLPAIEDRMALVTARSQTGGKKLKLADVRDQAFVTISKLRSPGFFGHMLALCAKHGFHPRIVQQVSEFPTALALTRAGMGVTMIPESYWNSDYKSLQIHRIAAADSKWKVGALWRRGDRNPALHRFLEALKTFL